MEAYIEILPKLLPGLWITIKILITSVFFTFLIAFIAGLGRVSRFKFVRTFTMTYVELFRGTSLLIQMFWIFYVLPVFVSIDIPAFWAGIIALSLNYGAYASEIVRGAINAIPKEQTEASIALNMTRFQRLRLVILPQAFRIMLPGFGNNSIELLKGTSLVSLITLGDLTYKGQMLQNTNLSFTFPVFVLLLIIYFIIALPLIIASRKLEQRASKGVA